MVTWYSLNYTYFTEVTGDSLQNKTATTQKQTKETNPSMRSFSQDTTACYFKIPSSCNTHSALELSKSSTENSSLFVCHFNLFLSGKPFLYHRFCVWVLLCHWSRQLADNKVTASPPATDIISQDLIWEPTCRNSHSLWKTNILEIKSKYLFRHKVLWERMIPKGST